VYPSVSYVASPEVLPSTSAGGEGSRKPADVTIFLLYLNSQTFVGEEGAWLVEEVRVAREAKLPFVMAHENDPDKNGCQFERFFTTTPTSLIQDGLYKQLALPLFPGVQDRKGSLAMIAKIGLGLKDVPQHLINARRPRGSLRISNGDGAHPSRVRFGHMIESLRSAWQIRLQLGKVRSGPPPIVTATQETHV